MAQSFEEYCRDVFDVKKIFSKPEPLKGKRFLAAPSTSWAPPARTTSPSSAPR
jgi:hypothetical protein